MKPVRVPDLRSMKERGEKIAVLTAYDVAMARLLDRAGIDMILVGDSLGMVVLGFETTLPVTLDMMIHHTKAVSRGAKRALIVADMPFLTFQLGMEEAMRNAGRLIQEGGAAAVKIEGGGRVCDCPRVDSCRVGRSGNVQFESAYDRHWCWSGVRRSGPRQLRHAWTLGGSRSALREAIHAAFRTNCFSGARIHRGRPPIDERS